MEQRIIDELIKCKKIISKKPNRAFTHDNQNELTARKDFKCQSEDGRYKFEVFMRKNAVIPSIFSIGLMFVDGDKRINLLRFNGKHFHKNKEINKEEFKDFHIHIANDKQPDRCKSFDAVRASYKSFESALIQFCNMCNIIDEDDCLGIKENRNNYSIDEMIGGKYGHNETEN